MSTVFLALQANEETRPVIEAIEIDNPDAVVNHEPAMVITHKRQITMVTPGLNTLCGTDG